MANWLKRILDDAHRRTTDGAPWPAAEQPVQRMARVAREAARTRVVVVHEDGRAYTEEREE